MATFQYQGRDANASKIQGEIEAANEKTALNQLKSDGVIVIKLVEVSTQTNQRGSLTFTKKTVSLDELILLTRQLYALTKAGVPIIRTLKGLADTTKNETLAASLNGISESLVSGMDLASSFGQHPKIYSKIYISMVHIGESTGRLDEALKKLIYHLELERETRKRIKSALRYPIMVVSAIAIAITVITLFVIPQFSNLFAKLGADLPLPTIILMKTSTFMVNYWWLVFGVFIAAFFGIRQYIKTDDGELWWAKFRITVPLLGPIFKRIALARFSRSFAMMLSAGVPLLKSLSIVAEAVGNRYIGEHIDSMRQGIERGERISSTAASTGMFTPLVMQMIAVGEETGSVDQLLNEVADFYEQEVDYDLKQLSDAIEPILIVFLGGVVLVLALGVFLPMWDMGKAALGN